MSEVANRARTILDEYLEEVTKKDRRFRAPGLWIFKPTPDHERFVAAVVKEIETAREDGYQAGVASMAEKVDWECICRCKTHRRIGCPLCLNVYACPVHSVVDPKVLRPSLLSDPVALAKAVWTTMRELAPDWVDLPTTWESTPPSVQDSLVEALRRVVSARAP